MEYIRKLPFILACFMTIVVGILGYRNDVPHQDIYLRMLVSLIVFLAIGMLLRGYLNKLNNNVQEKLQKKILEEKIKHTSVNERQKPSTIDYRIDDTLNPGTYEEEFTPLKVSEVIRTKIKNDP